MNIARFVTLIARIDVNTETSQTSVASEIIPTGDLTQEQAANLNEAVNNAIYKWLEAENKRHATKSSEKPAKIWTPNGKN